MMIDELANDTDSQEYLIDETKFSVGGLEESKISAQDKAKY